MIVYNPSYNCQCAKCTASRAKGQFNGVITFLEEAKAAWRAKQPAVKLGVVCVAAPAFWQAVLPSVDVAHPYLCVRTEIDPASEVTNIKAVRDVVKDKMGTCLAKVTWEAGAKVTPDKLKTIDGLATKDGIAYDPKAVATALGLDPTVITQAIARMKTK